MPPQRIDETGLFKAANDGVFTGDPGPGFAENKNGRADYKK